MLVLLQAATSPTADVLPTQKYQKFKIYRSIYCKSRDSCICPLPCLCPLLYPKHKFVPMIILLSPVAKYGVA